MKVTIIYGTETGNSESLAREANVIDMEYVTVEQLKNGGALLIITSTWGDGEPPSNAETLYQALKNSSEDLSDGDHDDTFPEWVDAVAETLS